MNKNDTTGGWTWIIKKTKQNPARFVLLNHKALKQRKLGSSADNTCDHFDKHAPQILQDFLTREHVSLPTSLPATCLMQNNLVVFRISYVFGVIFLSIILWTHHEDVTNPGIYPHQPPPKPLWANKGEKGQTHVFPATASPYTTGKDKPEPSTTVVGPKMARCFNTLRTVFHCDKKTHRKKLSFWVLSFECFFCLHTNKTRHQTHASSPCESEYVHAMI